MYIPTYVGFLRAVITPRKNMLISLFEFAYRFTQPRASLTIDILCIIEMSDCFDPRQNGLINFRKFRC